jgi:hypothetical protein
MRLSAILIRKFALVFHRILDFKTGLDFHPGPFFLVRIKQISE